MVDVSQLGGENRQAVGGGFGGVLGGFIIDELQNRAGVLLTSMEITMITVLSGLAVALWVKDNVRAVLEGQVTSLKNRLDAVTSMQSGIAPIPVAMDHAPYTPAGTPIVPPPPGV